MGMVLQGSDVVKRSHILRCLETSAGLQISRTRHDGLADSGRHTGGQRREGHHLR